MAVSWVELDCGYETPCHVWQGQSDQDGYPVIYRKNKRHLAHRFFYIEEKGPEPLPLHHRCETKMCVRVSHLQPITHADHNRLHKAGKPGRSDGGRGKPRPYARRAIPKL